MRANRRGFLGGLMAAGVIPTQTWADAGAPAYLSAAARPDGSYALCGIAGTLDIVFEIALPARGHAAAAHPSRPEAVAFARRPGTFAVVINCVSGRQIATLQSPEGRHFYGHGTFSRDGDRLFTTENDYEAGRGCIGVWDVRHGYLRVGEFDSGGIGPHDIKRLYGTDTLVIANGGIDTHPDSGRTKLNIPTMQANLAYIADGAVVETVTLDPEMRKNSIRHLAVNATGQVAFGMQWQGDGPVSALAGQHRRGARLELAAAPSAEMRRLDGYIGSIAYSEDGATIAVTSPRGSALHFYSAEQMVLIGRFDIADVCGVAARNEGFVATSGTGTIFALNGAREWSKNLDGYKWDNHLIAM